jgi:hypothetical protein
MTETAKSLQEWVENFENNPVAAGRAMGQLLAEDRRQFHVAALEMLKTARKTPGHAYLLTLAVEGGVLAEALSDPSGFTLKEAVAFVQAASEVEPLLEVKLVRWTLSRVRDQPDAACTPAALRILSILERTSTGSRLLPMLVQLLRVPDPSVRSKAAVLIGRGTKSLTWAMAETDPRVRANAIEAVWSQDSKRERGLLWELAKDSDNRVVGNALLALIRLGEAAASVALLKMASHPSPRFRATAAWVMGQTQDAQFLETLGQMQTDSDANVRRNASLATASISALSG